jgi:hypothetical protein
MAREQRFKWALSVLVAGALGAMFVSLASAGSRSSPSAHTARVSARSEARLAATRGGSRVVDIEFHGILQPGSVDGSVGTCPASAPHAISGYWGTDENGRDGDLVPVRSTPIGSQGRRWEKAVKNVSTTPITFFVGTVCLK